MEEEDTELYLIDTDHDHVMCSGDVKNPVNLSIALNHLPGNNIMSSFSNVATFQHNKISEYPFNDSLR